MQTIKPDRRYDIDWMRLLLILVVFFYHCGRAFHLWDWHVKDAVAPGLVVFLQFSETWMLPTIFVVSAASIWYSLGYQKPGKYIVGKILRLFVPLALGVFLLSPHQVYLERFTHGQFGGSFFQWLPHYFEGLYGLGDGGNFAFHGMHLWYLLMLFLYSLLLLPLFLFLRSKPGKPVIRAVGSFLSIPGVIYVLGLLLTLPMAYISRDSILGQTVFAGWNMVFYLMLLFFGFLIFADERIQAAIVRQRYVSIVLALGLYTTFRLGIRFEPDPANLSQYQYVLSSWCFITAILGFGIKYLPGTGRFLRYSSEAVLPFYMLHQPIILLVAYWVVQLQVPIIVKYGVIVVLSLAGIMLLYEGIKRVGVLRFVFGMKVRSRAVADPQK